MSQPVMKFEEKIVKLTDIKLDKTNPNQMSKAQEKALDLSMKKYGYVYEIVVCKNTMKVADGSHRLKNMMKKGITEAKVKLYPFKDEVERRKFRQIANKVRGSHQDKLDAEEYIFLLENTGMEDLSAALAVPEQEILNMLNKADKDVQEELKKSEEIDIHQKRTIVCPYCNESVVIKNKGEVEKA